MTTTLVIKADGTTQTVEFAPKDEVAYTTIHKIVGGYVEYHNLPHLGLTMWMNEDGKLLDLPYNHLATVLWREGFGPEDHIRGDVLISADTGSMHLTPEGVASLQNLLRTLASGSATL